MTSYLNYGTATENNGRLGAGKSGGETATWRRRSHFEHDNSMTWAGETMQMQNIPTDLLRTLIAVVDLRSFTKAAQMLGVTQPAVSAQIKRLQSLIGYELLDKSAPGVSLTQRGITVVAQARRLLAINDEILQVSNGHSAVQTLRVGIPGDYSGSRIPATLARFRLRWPDIGFIVTSGPADNMLRDLKQGDLDVVMAVTDAPPVTKPRHVWMRQAVWVRSDATRVDPDRPVPLVSYAEDCACQRVAVAALSQAGRRCDFVFTSASLTSLAAAVSAGFGVLAMPRGRALRNNLYIWEDPPLPPLPQLFCGIYVRDGEARSAADELADYLDADLRAEPQPPNYETGATISELRAASGA
jgi:DNA-binding transcriptional LysR family regulator